MISIIEYRKILNDYASSEEQIKKRLQYLDALCRNVAQIELQNYVRRVKQKRTKVA